MFEFKYDYEYLIHLIYCAVFDVQPQEKPEGISFRNVFELGREHEVANIAFLSIEKLETKPGDDVYNDWKIFYYFSVERDMKQELEYGEVLDMLHKNGIRTLEAQGTVTKTLYPASELRMMSDIDFIIDPENVEKVKELMTDRGYNVDRPQEFELDAFNGNKMEIEFHSEFFTRYMYNREERYYRAINKPFDHAEPSEEDGLKYVLSDTYFYLYSLLHIIKHFEVAGCGIRRILDLYFLKKAYAGKVDGELIDRVIDENGFRESYDTLFAVEALWFENEPTELDVSAAINDIINSGNHGAASIQTRNEIRKDRGKGERFVKLKKLRAFIFPRKEYIYLEFPECRERGYSTFACQIYRIFKKLFRFNFSHAKRYIKTIMKSD